jgi:hypothetical protein
MSQKQILTYLTHRKRWLVVLTILIIISQWEGLSHILWKIKNVPHHQPGTNCIELIALNKYWWRAPWLCNPTFDSGTFGLTAFCLGDGAPNVPWYHPFWAIYPFERQALKHVKTRYFAAVPGRKFKKTAAFKTWKAFFRLSHWVANWLVDCKTDWLKACIHQQTMEWRNKPLNECMNEPRTTQWQTEWAFSSPSSLLLSAISALSWPASLPKFSLGQLRLRAISLS